MLMSPSYSVLKLHQASGRIIRTGSKSLGTVRMLYGKYCGSDDVDEREQRIADALSRKTKTLSSLLDQAVKDGIKFPGEYVPIIEPVEDLHPQTEFFSSDVGINTVDLDVINRCITGEYVLVSKSGTSPPIIVRSRDYIPEPETNVIMEGDYNFEDEF